MLRYWTPRDNGYQKQLKQPKKKVLFSMYFIVILLLMIALVWQTNFLIFLFIAVLSFVINYRVNLLTFHIDLGQDDFLSLLLTRTLGLRYGILLVLFSNLVAKISTARLDKDSIISIIFSLFLNLIFVLLPTANFALFGAILITVKFIACLSLDFFLKSSPQEMIFETTLNFLVNIFLFLGFGDYALMVMKI
ncbi:hypothetical protein JW930_01710 [Candidatus Woesearchaeota archaeon]|nr:hypothetical protein [Candidatus Woesearchaeota archaeon]